MSLVDTHNVHTIKRDLGGIAIFIATIWVVFALDRFLPLEQLGLIPRELRGVLGIAAMPFLHGDINHIMGNTVPLAVNLLLLAGSRANSLVITVLIALGGGIGLWLFGREALHIGASGLVFGLVSFHIFAGIFERRPRSLLIAGIVGLLYFSVLFQGVLPFQQGVSWDGHLIGAIAGAVVALGVARRLRTAESSRPTSTADDPLGRRQTP